MRPKGIALGSATNWCVKSYITHTVFRHKKKTLSTRIWNFLLSFFAPRIVAKYVQRWFSLEQIFKYDDRIGPLILLIFFGSLLFGYGYVYLFIPETRGLSLEEVCSILFVITRESHSCRLMYCIVWVLNLGTRLSGNRILVKKRIRTLSKTPLKAFTKCKMRRRGPLKVLRLYLVNDLSTANFSSMIDMNKI